MISLDEVERIRNSDLPPSARHIFYELSIRADKEGFSFPSIKRLAHDTGYSENHIRKRLQQLEKAEWIAITRQIRKANIYEIRPIDEGPGNPFDTAPRAVSNPAPRDVHTAPRAVSNPAPRDVPTARGEAEALHETELPLHEDHEETRKGIDQIRRAWLDRNPPYWRDLDVTQARRLIDRYPAGEVINAINSYEHVNDLNPYQIANRIEILRDFPEFSHKKEPKKSQKRAKKEPKNAQKNAQNPLKN